MVRTNTEINRIVRDFVQVLESKIQVDRILLYGSYANGQPHEWSDIDLAVISRNFARMRRPERQAVIGDALTRNTNMIEALGYSVGEYTRADRQTFLGEIKRTGKTIYKRRKRSKSTQSSRRTRA